MARLRTHKLFSASESELILQVQHCDKNGKYFMISDRNNVLMTSNRYSWQQ